MIGRHDDRVQRLKLRVAPAVIGVIVRIDHILDGLVRHALQELHYVVVIDLELVVHEQHACVGDQRCHEAGDGDVADHVHVFIELDQRQLRRCASELPLGAEGRQRCA